MLYFFIIYLQHAPLYMLCYIYYVILYHIILCYVILYYIMLYYIMLYYIMLYYIIYYINVQLGVSTITQPSSDRPNMLK